MAGNADLLGIMQFDLLMAQMLLIEMVRQLSKPTDAAGRLSSHRAVAAPFRSPSLLSQFCVSFTESHTE